MLLERKQIMVKGGIAFIWTNNANHQQGERHNLFLKLKKSKIKKS